MEVGGFMIELPFTPTIDYLILSTDSNFTTEKEKHFNEDVFCKLLSEMQEIKPSPVLKIYAHSTGFYEKISELTNNANINVIFYFYYNENLNNLPDKSNVNLIFALNTPDLYEKINIYKNNAYNLILEPSDGFDKFAKTELEKIKHDHTIKNLFLQPYLTEAEIDKYSKKILNRKFLTCAAAWLNPVIDSFGNIFCCKYNKIGNIKQNTLLDLWNNYISNRFRENMTDKKNLKNCVSCLKKYYDNFLIVDNAELNYKGCKYKFSSSLNYVISAPKIAVTGEKISNTEYQVLPVPVFSSDDLSSLDNVLLLLE